VIARAIDAFEPHAARAERRAQRLEPSAERRVARFDAARHACEALAPCEALGERLQRMQAAHRSAEAARAIEHRQRARAAAVDDRLASVKRQRRGERRERVVGHGQEHALGARA
jgi:hypothetical protein